jgi:hypothetical protein
MKKKPKNQLAVAAGAALAPLAAAAMSLSYFTSRVGDNPFELGQLWFAAAAFVASWWSVLALVYTFNEQRKLTQNASRAVLQLVEIELHPSSPGYFWIFFKLHNHGQTAAFDVKVRGTLKFSPGLSEDGIASAKEASEHFESHTIEQIIPGGTVQTRYLSEDAESFLKLPENAGRMPYAGAGSSAPSELFITGVVDYTDIFEQPRQLPFEMKMLEMNQRSRLFVEMGAGFIGG